MIYTVIYKVQIIDNTLNYSVFGYTTDNTIIDSINSSYDTSLGEWIEENKDGLTDESITMSEFFIEYGGSYVYVARTTVTNIDGLTEITNLNQL